MKLKKYSARIPVGAEQTLTGGGPCSVCGQPAGIVHSFGCANEECPSCHKILVGCSCNCLSSADAEKIIKVLHDQFTCFGDAAEVVAADPDPGRDSSYLVHAAMQYLYEHLPPAVRDDLHRDFQTSHPDLVPLLQDENGFGYYTAEQLSATLQIPLTEVYEKIEAMLDAGQGIRFGDGIRLHKVN